MPRGKTFPKVAERLVFTTQSSLNHVCLFVCLFPQMKFNYLRNSLHFHLCGHFFIYKEIPFIFICADMSAQMKFNLFRKSLYFHLCGHFFNLCWNSFYFHLLPQIFRIFVKKSGISPKKNFTPRFFFLDFWFFRKSGISQKKIQIPPDFFWVDFSNFCQKIWNFSKKKFLYPLIFFLIFFICREFQTR